MLMFVNIKKESIYVFIIINRSLSSQPKCFIVYALVQHSNKRFFKDDADADDDDGNFNAEKIHIKY